MAAAIATYRAVEARKLRGAIRAGATRLSRPLAGLLLLRRP